MLRLTLLLCIGMFAALMTLGEDRGQLRPGLALAAAEGRLDEVWAEARARAAAAPVVATAAQPAAQPVVLPVVEAAPPEPRPAPAPTPAPILASVTPTVDITPGREVVQRVEERVFSLSALGNEAVPGETAASPASSDSAAAAPPEGAIWYVTASSVNVRAAPSTQAEILGRLNNGEAALMVAAVDDEWAQIVIQGDGLEGYVAIRYLSSLAP